MTSSINSDISANQYTGYLVVANPFNPTDDLRNSVVLLISHGNNVAVGIQLNCMLEEMTLKEVAQNIGIDFQISHTENLYHGGNFHTSRVHVVHSSDWQGLSTVKLTDDISITNDISILNAIARGDGPRHYRPCAGYWIWDGDSLERQLDSKDTIEAYKWEICPATIDLVFNHDGSEQWKQALIESAHFSASIWF